jgi:hypothetical protein
MPRESGDRFRAFRHATSKGWSALLTADERTAL